MFIRRIFALILYILCHRSQMLHGRKLGSKPKTALRKIFSARKPRAFVEPRVYHMGRLPACNAIRRTGVCVPEDVGLYGRLVVSYECQYTKDNRTQTGDEWEREMCEEARFKQGKKFKKPQKERKVPLPGREPSKFERFIVPPPYNTTGMLLREGDPYLTLSCWLPGLKSEDIHVIMDYSAKPVDANGYVNVEENLSCCNDTLNYYADAEAIPPSVIQHADSYNSTYNDLYNRMIEGDPDGYYNKRGEAAIPPLFLINAPKNAVVKQWERATFVSRREPEIREKYSRIQRAYRPLAHVDLRNIDCIYSLGTLQMRMRLTHIKPPPNKRGIYKLPISQQGEVTSPRYFPIETVHGWMYNWHHFSKYDLSFDLSKFDKSQVDPALYEAPNFDDDTTHREYRKIMRRIDEMERKE